jgi:hypothetical protein
MYQIIVPIYIDMSQAIHSVKTDTAYHTIEHSFIELDDTHCQQDKSNIAYQGRS